jgi:hypothetical protein
MLKLYKNETKEKIVIIKLSHPQNIEIPQKFIKKKCCWSFTLEKEEKNTSSKLLKRERE